MRQWIITAGGDTVPIEGDAVEFILGRKLLFGLTDSDCRFVQAKMASNAPDVWHALLSRILVVGIAVECPMDVQAPGEKVRRRGWRHIGSNSPPSLLERGKKLEEEDDPTMMIEQNDVGEIVVAFHRESHQMWARLIKWIERLPAETNVHAKTVVILKEWETQRGWAQNVEGIFRDYQFARDPSKGGKCNRCGTTVSWSEMVGKYDPGMSAMTCPKCGLPLA